MLSITGQLIFARFWLLAVHTAGQRWKQPTASWTDRAKRFHKSAKPSFRRQEGQAASASRNFLWHELASLYDPPERRTKTIFRQPRIGFAPVTGTPSASGQGDQSRRRLHRNALRGRFP